MHAALCIGLVIFLMLFPSLSNRAASDIYFDRSSPQFSAEEFMMIVDHEPLLAAFRDNPWMLRRVMDAVRASAKTNADNDTEGEGEKATPEASHDLFQILKKLQSGGGDR